MKQKGICSLNQQITTSSCTKLLKLPSRTQITLDSTHYLINTILNDFKFHKCVNFHFALYLAFYRLYGYAQSDI